MIFSGLVPIQLCNEEFGFRSIVNVTGTPYVGDDYFPDVVFRYGLKQAIADRIVKKPNYKLEDTFTAHDWQKNICNPSTKSEALRQKTKTNIHHRHAGDCTVRGSLAIAKEGISPAEADKKAIWVTSGVPSSGDGKARVENAYLPRDDKDSPEKRRKENLALLKQVDDSDNQVEWIVSVSMLTEGWDVKNIFQIVPHESRAFSSKLLIAQVLGRGLRVPPNLPEQPLVTINNHEAWSEEVGNLLKEVLEIENTLSWGYDPRRNKYVFPLYNLRYAPELDTIEAKQEKAKAPDVKFLPQERKTTEYSTFSVTGKLAIEIEHQDLYEIDDAVKLLRLFLREKDQKIASEWPKKRLHDFIIARLKAAGQGQTFLSKENLLRLQQGFGPMFRELDKQHPRMSQTAKEIVRIDLAAIPRQSFSESSLKEHGTLYTAKGDSPFNGHEARLWEHYQRLRKQFSEFGDDASDQSKAISPRIKDVDLSAFKSPWNVHYVSHEPERKFSDLLFENGNLFDAFAKMPNIGGYSFPYSYKPANAAKTHVTNENFNPDFFVKIAGALEILVVEIKIDGDDSNRNRAKCRDGLKHFEALNEKLKDAGEESAITFISYHLRITRAFLSKYGTTLMQDGGQD